jgi:NADPH:quinone reductase-like Zn-dependent oxidoreductase
MVLVKVVAAALNPVDSKILTGRRFPVKSWPHVLGCDMAGTVAEAAHGSPFKPGDKVFGYTSLGEPHSGTLAEYCLVPSDMLAAVPPAISMEAASTVGLGALTAGLGLYAGLGLPFRAEATGVGKPPAVLVYGASSSVGQYAVQLAKLAGARVIAVASSKHHAMLLELGADAALDYHDAGWERAVAEDPANAGLVRAFDAIGGPATRLCADILAAAGARGAGVVVTTVRRTPPDTFDDVTAATGVKVKVINCGAAYTAHRAEVVSYMKEFAKMLEAGELRPNRARVLEGGLEAAKAGLEELMGGKVRDLWAALLVPLVHAQRIWTWSGRTRSRSTAVPMSRVGLFELILQRVELRTRCVLRGMRCHVSCWERTLRPATFSRRE